MGTAQFGQKYGISSKTHQPDDNEARKIIEFARVSEINTLDTAMSYGSSERVIGRIGISDFSTITKLSPLPQSKVEICSWLEDKIKQSLQNLRVDKLHGLLVHRVNDLIEDRGIALIKALERIKEDGLVEKIGISAYSPGEVEAVRSIFNFDIIQIPLNIFDRRFEESGILINLKNSGIEIHARSIFLQGLLLLPRNTIPPKFSRWGHQWNRYHTFLIQENWEPIALCLSYPLSLPELDKIVIGVDSVSHLKDIVKNIQSDFKFVNTSKLKSDDEELIDASLW